MSDNQKRVIEILADRLTLSIVMLGDGRYWIDPDIFQPIQYLQDEVIPTLLDVEHEVSDPRLPKRWDHYRKTKTYQTVKEQVRRMVRNQLKEATNGKRERGNAADAHQGGEAAGA